MPVDVSKEAPEVESLMSGLKSKPGIHKVKQKTLSPFWATRANQEVKEVNAFNNCRDEFMIETKMKIVVVEPKTPMGK